MRSWLPVLVVLPMLAGVVALTCWVIGADRDAQLAERVRLALWRMDARAGAVVQAEAARPSEHWQSFFAVDRAYDDVNNDNGGLRLASPLLSPPAPPVLLHAEQEADGRLSSPQVPVGTDCAPAVAGYVEQTDIDRMAARLADFRLLVPARPSAAATVPATVATSVAASLGAMIKPPPLRMPPAERQADGVQGDDFQNRAGNQRYNSANIQSNAYYPQQKAAPPQRQAVATPQPAAPRPMPVATQVGPFHARWWQDRLVLERTVRGAGGERRQYVWLDHRALAASVVAEAADLLPHAGLLPAGADDIRRLAALPFRLEPGAVDLPLSDGTIWLLILAWLGVIAGCGSVVVLAVLAGRLAERRAAFVSAVTHELRTPLTALRLHADLLADARIGGDATRRTTAIERLRAEAVRLGHLVENVLDYARLERRPPRPALVAVDALLAPIIPRLAERLAAAGLTLQPPGLLSQALCRCDAAAVERILANLVDNAAKYAARGNDPRVILDCSVDDRWVRIRLVDHGPGLDAGARARLFRPFARSAEAAAGAAPGIGLGLALCRRMAAANGGALRIADTPGGGLTAELDLPR